MASQGFLHNRAVCRNAGYETRERPLSRLPHRASHGLFLYLDIRTLPAQKVSAGPLSDVPPRETHGGPRYLNLFCFLTQWYTTCVALRLVIWVSLDTLRGFDKFRVEGLRLRTRSLCERCVQLLLFIQIRGSMICIYIYICFIKRSISSLNDADETLVDGSYLQYSSPAPTLHRRPLPQAGGSWSRRSFWCLPHQDDSPLRVSTHRGARNVSS
jgi:hypothetical protein